MCYCKISMDDCLIKMLIFVPPVYLSTQSSKVVELFLFLCLKAISRSESTIGSNSGGYFWTNKLISIILSIKIARGTNHQRKTVRRGVLERQRKKQRETERKRMPYSKTRPEIRFNDFRACLLLSGRT